MNRSIYRDRRVYHVVDLHGDRSGWYFELRGAGARGPFVTRKLAEAALAEFLAHAPDCPREQDSVDGDEEGQE